MDDLTTLSFGEWVRRRRKALDLTQAQLGQRAGCSAAAIRKIEAEERRPSAQLAELLARALQVSGAEREPFLAAARGLAPPAAAPPASGAAVAIPATPNNLPAPMTSFVNRTRDIAAVTARLRERDVRVLTLIGPPGIGKTRLAIQAAEALMPDFPAGVWFVDLTALEDPALVLPAIAHSVRLQELADEPLPQRLQRFWGEQRVLLLLDNFEHVVGAAPEVGRLLRACRGLKVLATSRVPLQIYGEHEYAAPPLSLPPAGGPTGELMDYEAAQLFVTRVRQHQPGFGVDAANAADLQEILRKLEGLPLAIELAAATVRRMPLARLAEVLQGSDWVRALEAQARDLPSRQRTLANAIAWSYDRMDPTSTRWHKSATG
jgi:transcriptional regulator with XRE-family HTH domain